MDTLKYFMDCYKSTSDLYYSTVWSTIGAFLISIGWVLTSDKARDYLAHGIKAKSFAIITIVLIELIHLIFLFKIQAKSEKIMNLINGIINNSEVSQLYLIPKSYPFGSGLTTFGLALALITFIILLKNKNEAHNNLHHS